MDALITWLTLVGISVGFTVVTFWGLGGLVHHHYYVRRRDEAQQWKLQPKRFLSDKKNRLAFWLGSGNMLIGAVLGGSFAAYIVLGGWSLLETESDALPLWWHPISAVLLFVLFDAGLYYVHRLGHRRWFFKRFHHLHHKFTAPTVFTMVATHPVEFVLMQSVLIISAFLVPAHWAVYVVVVLYTYLIGAIDHVGVRQKWPLPFHSSPRFHDDHHVYFHCNYGHHTTFWDQLHGTVRQVDRHYDETTFEDDAPVVTQTTDPA